MTLVRRIARPMLAAIFVEGGIDTLRHPQGRAAKAAPFLEKYLAPLGVTQDPELLVRANAAAMILGGSLLAMGRLPRPAAALLAGFLVPTTVAGHPFWAETDPAARKAQQMHFQKNVGLLGGLLLAAVDTEGGPGLAFRAGMAKDAAARATKTTRRQARQLARSAKQQAKLGALHAKGAVS